MYSMFERNRTSIFTIDLRSQFPYLEEANFIRIAALHDRLYEDAEAIHREEDLIIAIYDGNKAEIKAYAKALLRYLDETYGEDMITLQSLKRLVKI